MAENEVLDAYTSNPYPKRDPADELKRLVPSSFGYMKLVNSIFWGGKKKIRSGFRVLDAGCGTGDAAIHIAEQLRGTGADIVALDFSAPALDIARKRAKIRGLDNITFIEDSILNIPGLGIGKFDYIVCTAVLQHLDDSSAGLKILSDCLKEDGGMGIQINSYYGRFPIRIVQQAISILNKNETEPEKKIANAREVFASLSKDHWFKPDESGRYDEWVYDSLLTSHTKEFTVPELFDLADSAGMQIVRFKNRVAYDPEFYMKGRVAHVSSLPFSEQAALAELLEGKINTHQFFLSRARIPQPDPADGRMVPDYLDERPGITKSGDVTLIESQIPGYKFSLKMFTRYSNIFELIDGKRSVGQIVEEASAQSGVSPEESMKAWLWIYGKTKAIDLILLNSP
jgi:ubiquinone/menaquinone biosynthesis C-methylase UbiE